MSYVTTTVSPYLGKIVYLNIAVAAGFIIAWLLLSAARLRVMVSALRAPDSWLRENGSL